MRWIVLALAVWPGSALADWVRVDSDVAVRAALAGREVVYDAHTSQGFGADGTTLHVTERAAQGRWEARGGQYCSLWSPSTEWTCYDLDINDNRLGFTGPGGSVGEGVYAE